MADIQNQLPVKITDNENTVIVTDDSALKVDGSHVVQPISGTVTAVASGTFATENQKIESASITSVTVSNLTSTILLNSNSDRSFASFYNEGNEEILIKLGSSAATSSYSLKVYPNGYFEMPSSPIYTGVIEAISLSTNVIVRITEI